VKYYGTDIDMPKDVEERFERIKNRVHGSPYDRGSSDSYYRRGRNPHYYPEGTGHGERITDLTPEQLADYHQGYDDNEADFNFKDWN
jgi:hypothetical protein